MLAFWVIASAIAVAAALLIARPLFAQDSQGPEEGASPDALQAEIDAIARDREYQLIDGAGAAEAEKEARANADVLTAANAAGGVSRIGRMAAVAAIGAAPIAAALLYLNLGAPEAFDASKRASAAPAAGIEQGQADAIGAMSDDERRQMIEAMVAGLADRLSREPEDPEGWRMLARSYRVLGRPADSANAWRELMKREEGGADDWRDYAYALMETRRADGAIEATAELERALLKLQGFNADDPLALFGLGQAAFNRGDKAAARASWMRLKEILPPDAPIMPTLDKMIEDTN